QRVAGQVVVGGRGREGVSRLFVDGGAAGHAGQDRGDIDLADGQGDRLLVVETGTAVVGDPDLEGVASGTLGFGRRPGEDTRAGIDAGAGRSADETEGQRIGRQVVVGRRGREGVSRLFVDGGARGHPGQDRGDVDLAG